MRFSMVYKYVQLSGFFWNNRFVFYGNRWCGWAASTGTTKNVRLVGWRAGDGTWARGFVKRRPQPFAVTQNMALMLLEYTTPFMSATTPWAWKILLNIKVRSYLSSRLKTSLPAHGQRTRSNHSSAKNNRDKAAQRLVAEDWASISGFLSGRGSKYAKKKNIPSKKARPSGKAKKAPAVRSAKKPNVWR